jgi:hypothetical protein
VRSGGCARLGFFELGAFVEALFFLAADFFLAIESPLMPS